jgi:hypothetical protein
MFTVQCRTICSPWEFYYSHVHSSVSYNVFTLRVLLLPGSQFSVVQYVLPESFITPRFTVQCRTICSSWVLLLPGSQFSVVQCVHLESFITPIFTVQCRTICSPWEFYYSHVHSSVSYNMFTLRVLLLLDSPFSVIGFLQHFPQYQLYHETMGKENITNSRLFRGMYEPWPRGSQA